MSYATLALQVILIGPRLVGAPLTNTFWTIVAMQKATAQTTLMFYVASVLWNFMPVIAAHSNSCILAPPSQRRPRPLCLPAILIGLQSLRRPTLPHLGALPVGRPHFKTSHLAGVTTVDPTLLFVGHTFREQIPSLGHCLFFLTTVSPSLSRFCITNSASLRCFGALSALGPHSRYVFPTTCRNHSTLPMPR